LLPVDVIAAPTLCLTPPLMPEVAGADSHLRVNRRIVRNTIGVNYLGLCAITLPVGHDRAGMPVGLQLTAPAHAEEKLLTIALAAERVLGTAVDRLGTPPLLAREKNCAGPGGGQPYCAATQYLRLSLTLNA
jgi:aspartyl-tRNA(Asn)/glutamyl-tRNA(Gln) amidotransferase subunit A